MIYYFSGTGNSEWVAKEIAKNISDEAVNIIDIIRSGKESLKVSKNETLGIVFPIYAWAVPEVIESFLKILNLEDGAYTYAIGTCGEEAGLALKKLSKVIKLNSCYSIVMPNNYIIGSDMDSDIDISKKIEDAKDKILEICNDIKERKNKYDVFEGNISFFKANIVAPVFNKFGRDTKSFWVEDSCIGCGICQENCPTGCIKLNDNKKPLWNGNCYQCLSCINRCPKQSIQYGNKTKNRSRYIMKQI